MTSHLLRTRHARADAPSSLASPRRALLPLALCAVALLPACEPEETNAAAGASSPEPAAAAHEATLERLMQRVSERTELTCAAEWIEAYDFLHPNVRRSMTLVQFLQGKDRHSYAEPSRPELVHRDGDTAYVTYSVLWTPRLDMTPGNVPADWDPTQRIEWIETWEHDGSDWSMLWPVQDLREFYEDHPELLRGDSAAGSESDDAR